MKNYTALAQFFPAPTGRRMPRSRDSQRSKVYTAELKAFEGAPVDLPEIEDIERYIAHICSLGRVKDSFPELAWRSITVGDGRRRRSAGGDGRGIYMPRWSRKRWVVLHELSHTIMDRRYRNATDHGWQYAEVYLTLVRHVMGVDAHDRLKAQFKAHRVRYKAPRARKPVSPEQRAILIERMRLAREAKLQNAA